MLGQALEFITNELLYNIGICQVQRFPKRDIDQQPVMSHGWPKFNAKDNKRIPLEALGNMERHLIRRFDIDAACVAHVHPVLAAKFPGFVLGTALHSQ